MKVLKTIEQYIKLTGTTRRTINRQINAGKLEALRDPKDKHWLIPVDIKEEIKQN